MKSFYNKTNFNDLFLTVGDDKIFPSTSAKNLGVVIDTNLKLDKYISNTCKTAYFHIIFHITNKIDYCNSLLYGMPDNVLNRLQKLIFLKVD